MYVLFAHACQTCLGFYGSDVRVQMLTAWSQSVISKLADVVSGAAVVSVIKTGNTDFQITRGHTGVSV